jgi:IS1 family transposase/transposase-like protein
MKLKKISCSKCVGNNTKIIRFGKTRSGKQRFQCTYCRATYLSEYSYQAYRKSINHKIVILIKEGLGIRSIARVLKISPTTLLKRIIVISKAVKPPYITYGKIYEVDELRTFVKSKRQVVWLVYALDKVTKNVVSFNLGKRTNQILDKVIKTLINSQAQKICTDKLRNYQYLIPKEIHSTKRFGTNSIERMNLTIRTNLKRFNRRSICFSKSIIILNAILRIYFWG